MPTDVSRMPTKTLREIGSAAVHSGAGHLELDHIEATVAMARGVHVSALTNCWHVTADLFFTIDAVGVELAAIIVATQFSTYSNTPYFFYS